MRIDRLPSGLYAIRSSYSPALVAACKAVPGCTWDPVERAWVGYADAIKEIDYEPVRRGLGYAPPIAYGFVEVANDIVEGLRSYQTSGVAFLTSKSPGGALLADVMGAGKTAQALRAAKALNQRTLIVCPSFVRGVWEKELGKWWPEASYGVLEGVKETHDIPPWLVTICHYDILHAWVPRLLAWMGGPRDVSTPGPKTLILDEAHFVSNSKSRRSTACKQLGAIATHRIGLSGTPLTNRPRDLWNVVDILSPGRFGSFFKYGLRYCDATQESVGHGANAKVVWNFDGRSHLDELKRRLSYFMLRRTHEDINLELPALTRQVVELKVPSRYRLNVDRGVSQKAMRRALDLAADGKMKEIVAMCRQHVEDGHKVVVFCHRRSAAEHIANECVSSTPFGMCDGGVNNSAFIHGGISQKYRNALIEDQRKIEGPSLLAATIDVASVGIDLSFADVCVFAELTWEPHELAQAEARVYRFGATKPILVQYCVALGTGEELIRDRLILKMEQVLSPTLGAKGQELAAELKGPMTDEDALRALWEAL